MNKIIWILNFGFLVFSLGMKAQVYQTKPIGRTIYSLRTQTVSEALSEDRKDPVRSYLTLPNSGIIDGSDEDNTLEISFDELSHDIHQYSYSVHHLGSDFQMDDLQTFEYVRGFTRDDIVNYTTSLNTAINYTHYSFTFPNENMQLTASGNYLIRIFEIENGEEHTIAQVVFQVVEPIVQPEVQITPNTTKEISGRYQQVNITLNTQGLQMVSPNDIKILIRQNDRIDNQVYAPYPTYVEPSKLTWRDQTALVFEGGNEYRHCDLWSTYFAGYNVVKIRYFDGEYHAFLMPDPVRGTLNPEAGRCGTNYMHEFDHNGMKVINAERCSDIDSEAEYMYVHWCLQAETPILDGGIYIGGDLFNNQTENGLNRMLYDHENHYYYFNALLKQGGYDYQYWLKKKGEPSATLLMTEGSHWQTENVYTIYIYFRAINDRYDRLVGIYSSPST